MFTPENKPRSYLLLLKIGAIAVSLFYFVLTVDYLVTRGAPIGVCVVAALVWAPFVAGIAAFKP